MSIIDKLFRRREAYCLKCGYELEKYDRHFYCNNKNCERHGLSTVLVIFDRKRLKVKK